VPEEVLVRLEVNGIQFSVIAALIFYAGEYYFTRNVFSADNLFPKESFPEILMVYSPFASEV
jgi:hypothetical protein